MAATVSVVEDAEDYSFLPLIHDIIKCMDKDNQDVHQELNKLRTRIQDAREQISAMPGIDASPEVQQHDLRTLRDQVRTKKPVITEVQGPVHVRHPETFLIKVSGAYCAKGRKERDYLLKENHHHQTTYLTETLL